MNRTAERKLVSVLFADLTGFTSLAEKLDPEDVSEMLLPGMESLQKAVEDLGGTIVQVAGDGFFAVFGAPRAQEDHAERAVRAAFAIRDRARTVKLPEVHAGVNSGEVFLSPSQDRAGFTLYGDAVNVASRLCDLAPPGTILCGERARELAAHAISFGPSLRKRVKGKAEEIEVAEALAPSSVTGHGRSPFSRSSTFGGRETEIEILRSLLDAAYERGSANVVVVRGDAGIGKSRLAHEFLSSVERASILVGRCSPYAGRIPLYALAHAFAGRAGMQPEIPEASDALRQMAAEIGLSRHAASTLVAFCGAEHEQQEPLTLADSSGIIREVLSALAERQAPVILIIDDVHWADPDLVNWLSTIEREPLRIPLLIVALSRPDVPRSLSRLQRIDLRALPGLVMREIAHELFATAPPESLLNTIIARSTGNPLFLEECIGMVLDSGALTLESGGWRLIDPAIADEVPATLRALLSARVDSLDALDKRTLQIAAVCGAVTWDLLLEHLEPRSAQAVRSLEDRGLLHRRDPSAVGTELEFKHALIRDVAEASVPKRRRAELHLRIAAWLQQRFAESPGPVEVIAYHFERAFKLGVAEAAGDAVNYLTRWANEAFLHQARLAEGIYTRAIGIASQKPIDAALHASALAGRAEALLEHGRHAHARADARRARRLAKTAKRADLVARSALIEGSVDSDEGNVSRGRALLNEARDIFRDLQDRKGEAAALFRLASTYRLDDLQRVVSILRESRALAREAGDHWGQARATQDLAYLLSASSSKEFRPVFAEASLLIGDQSNLRLRASLLRTEAYRAMLSAEYERAVELTRRARALAQQAGTLSIEADTLLVEGTALCALGFPTEALEVTEKILPIASKLRSKGLRALAFAGTALPLSRLCERRHALVRLASARKTLRTVQPVQLIEVDLAEASLHLDGARFARVFEPAQRAESGAPKIGYEAYGVFGKLAVGRAHLGSGNYDQAQAELTEAARVADDAPGLRAFALACVSQAEMLAGGAASTEPPAPVSLAGFVEFQAVVAENEAIRNNGSFASAIELWKTLGTTSWLGRALAFDGRDAEADEIFRELGAPAKIRSRFSSSIERVRKGGVSWRSL